MKQSSDDTSIGGLNNHSSTIDITYQLADDGFSVEVFDKKYSVKYPSEIWSNQTNDFKRILVENFVYSRAKSLCLKFDRIFNFKISRPVVRELVNYGIRQDLPRLAWLSKIKIPDLVDIFNRNVPKEVFNQDNLNSSTLTNKLDSKDKAILALSFGKDSLLSYGLAKELGLDLHLVYVKEMVAQNQPEENFKQLILEDFSKKEKVEIEFLFDNVDEISLGDNGDRKIEDLENTNGMLAFTLELLPFSHHYGAKYLIFGNEANFSDFFSEGEFKIYPSFDQSVIYADKINRLLNQLIGGRFQVASLVEPIYNLVEMAILVNRYPRLLPYLMSCSPQSGDLEKWCYHCPMCAKAFVYLVAVGGRPEQIGFSQDFFSLRYQSLYPLFNDQIERAYEKPESVRDEQLLAFLMSYRRGVQGELIDLFKSKYLALAESREVELRKKFLDIHELVTVPDFLRQKLIKIYQEEIKKIL